MRVFFSFVAAFLIASALPARATILNQTGDVALGQNSFAGFAANFTDGKGFIGPEQVLIDTTTGRLFVVDAQNYRVLWWNNKSSLVSGQAADGVIGQADLYGSVSNCTASNFRLPTGVALDPSGNLWVADAAGNRVMKFVPPFTTGMSATVALGQSALTNCFSANGQNQMANPIGIAFDSAGNLWAAESDNNRVTKWTPPFSTNMNATLALGQSAWGVGVSALSQSGFNYPYSVAVDTNSGDVFVADQNNKRVLIFQPPFSMGMNAKWPIGEADFTSNGGGTTASLIGGAQGVYADPYGNLWVSDSGNNRVLEFTAPFSTAEAAAFAIGVSNLTSGGGGASATLLSGPRFVTRDATTGDLWVPDALNNRVLKYPNPPSMGEAAALVLGQLDFAHAQLNYVDGAGINGPRSVAIDTNTARVYAVDQNNGRVLWWNSLDALTTGKTADGVLGHSLLTDSQGTGGGAGASAFANFATGIAVDGSGAVWVTDAGCNRVMEFKPPITSGMSATLALGQASASACAAGGATQSLLNNPLAVAADSSGNIWVADSANNRALKFSPPFSSGMNASLVLGQAGYFTSATGFTATAIANPQGIAVDSSGSVWLVDTGNNRVLKFAAPLSNGMAATAVLGEPDFVSSGTILNAAGLRNPVQATFDPAGNLWVADAANKRVLAYNPPFSNGMNAGWVLGQPNFTSNGGSVSSTHLGSVYGVAVSSSGDVVAADVDDTRELVFYAPAMRSLSLASVSASSLTFSWALDASATGYKFYPSTGGAAISLGAAVSSVTLIGLSAGQTAGGRVSAVYAFGEGTPSAQVLGSAIQSGSIGASGGTLTFTQTQGTVSVGIAPGAFSSAVGISIQPPTSIPSGRSGFGAGPVATGVGVQVTVTPAAQPALPCFVTLGYRAADIAGLDQSTLVVARYDPIDGVWIPLPSAVNRDALTVTAQTSHFSLFQIMANGPAPDVSAPVVFPNPFRPSLGHTAITFANLPAGADLEIFTLAGRKVRKLTADGAGLASWDGNNGNGSPAASGVYFVLARGTGALRKTFKVIIQR